jgi:DNA-binding response OmpR family regulator
MKVVIADDDRALVHMLGAAFRKRGWEVVQAFDAMQAIMYSNRSPPPDAVVLDLGMPGGTGFGVLERLARSSRTSAIPVVVITGSKDDEDVDRALGLGATEFLQKPVEPETLIDEVETIVGGSPD